MTEATIKNLQYAYNALGVAIAAVVAEAGGTIVPPPGPGPVEPPPIPQPPLPPPAPAGLRVIELDFAGAQTAPEFDISAGEAFALHFRTDAITSPRTINLSCFEYPGPSADIKFCLSTTPGDLVNQVDPGAPVRGAGRNPSVTFVVNAPGLVSGGGSGFKVGANLQPDTDYWLNMIATAVDGGGSSHRRVTMLKGY